MNEDNITVKNNAINFVLCGTSHPGNIGAAARALKAMSQTRLTLVKPKQYPSAEATARAAGADDLLASASVVDTVGDAIGDANVIFGASARLRSNRWPVVDARQSAQAIDVEVEAHKNVAILFGNERSGLSNEELSFCHTLIHIPVNESFSSLNLSAAVQIVAYELNMLGQSNVASDGVIDGWDSRDIPSTSADMQSFHRHFYETMVAQGYLNPDNPGQVVPRMKRLFMRANPSRNDLKILHGFLKAKNKQ